MTIGALNEKQTIKAPAGRAPARGAHQRAQRRRRAAGHGAPAPRSPSSRPGARAAAARARRVEVPAVPRRRRPGRQEAAGLRTAHRPVTLSHVAIGTWSGGRFMHFGQPLDDERLVALLRPDARIPTVITADAYGAGEADRVLGARARGPRPRRATSSSARSATTSTRASARARRASRASPIRGCAGRRSTARTCGWPPSAASSASAPTTSTSCCCTTRTAPATRARRCGRGWRRCATPA